jgi:hypothetical protein
MTPKTHEVELEITSSSGAKIAMKGDLGNLDDQDKVHKLLDLLGLPKGTEVRITSKVGSVIVR